MKKLIGLSVVLIVFALAAGLTGQFTQSFRPFAQAATSDKSAASAKPVVDDREIDLRVQAALAKDKDIAALSLTVKTLDGNVGLAGVARSRSQADRAVLLARSVPGVKAVKNEIRVS